jgi:probable F420-dependent oxidoreductase
MTNDKPARRMQLGVISTLDEGGMNGKTPRYQDVQAMAQAAEQANFDSFWLADHLIFRFPNQPEQGCWEVFTFLSAVAATTSRISLGPLVACTSFRNPALLAKMADSLDEISGGRLILGLGAGWHEPEYTAFGYPFDHRAARFEEALKIIVPLLREGQVDFAGEYYQARETVLRPRGPSGARLPIWIGARRPRMLKLVAHYADAWNTVWHKQAPGVTAVYPDLLAACQEVGRDPAAVELTAGTFARVLAPGEARAADETKIAGTPEEVATALKAFEDAGVRHLIVIVEPEDITGIERFARVIELLDQMPR